jgi:hypothetical protein
MMRQDCQVLLQCIEKYISERNSDKISVAYLEAP